MTGLMSIGIAGSVVAMLISVLVAFPVSGAGPASAAGPGTADEAYSVEAVEQAGDLFTATYTSIITELVSYQKDADYERAEARYQELASYGASVKDRYGEFGERAQIEYAGLQAEAEQTAAAATQ